MSRLSYQLISIEISDNGQAVFHVPEETRAYLLELHTNITPIAAVGPYRSGKSWMLGYLSKQQNAFTTSNGSQACTRGIHINSVPYTTNNLLFMDTEGLGATGSNIELDSKILACSILFASKVYFFVCGKVDSNLLSSLQCAIGTATWLKDAANNQCFNFQKPQLVVVIKDLTLELQDDNGNRIEPTQYLQLCLQKYSQSNPQFQTAIEALFSDITCLTTAIPCAEQDMKDMKNLSAAFQRDVAAVARDAYNKTNPKLIAENTPMNGPVLLQMAEGLCAALTQPGAPRLLSVWESALQQAAIERKHQLLVHVRSKMQVHFNNRLATWRPSTITLDDIYSWLNNALSKTPTQSLKFDEVAQVLRAVFDECKAFDDTQLESSLQQIGDDYKSLTSFSQWCSVYLPQSLRDMLCPHLEIAMKLESELEELKKDLQQKTETIDALDVQINSFIALPPCPDVQASSETMDEIQTLRRQLQGARTHNEELSLVNTTFQTEFGKQLAMMRSANSQVQSQLEQTNNLLSKSEKEQQDAHHKLREKTLVEQKLRETIKELEKDKQEESRKRKLDELVSKRSNINQETMQKKIDHLQRELELRATEQQKLQLELVQAQCKSMFAAQPMMHRT